MLVTDSQTVEEVRATEETEENETGEEIIIMLK